MSGDWVGAEASRSLTKLQQSTKVCGDVRPKLVKASKLRVVSSNQELNHIKLTISIIESSAKNISEDICSNTKSEVNKTLITHIFGKLERLINSIENLLIPENMEIEVERKNSLIKHLQYLKSCTEVQTNLMKTKCQKCKWLSCQCEYTNDDPLNF